MEHPIASRSETTPFAVANPGVDIDIISGQPLYPLVKHVVQPANTTPVAVKGSGNTKGIVCAVSLSHAGTGMRYLKLYDKATAPVVGTDIPKQVFGIPAAWSREVNFPPVAYQLGMWMTVTTGAADSDNTAPNANEVVADVYYL